MYLFYILPFSTYANVAACVSQRHFAVLLSSNSHRLCIEPAAAALLHSYLQQRERERERERDFVKRLRSCMPNNNGAKNISPLLGRWKTSRLALFASSRLLFFSHPFLGCERAGGWESEPLLLSISPAKIMASQVIGVIGWILSRRRGIEIASYVPGIRISIWMALQGPILMSLTKTLSFASHRAKFLMEGNFERL
jgi:hypothetical protein